MDKSKIGEYIKQQRMKKGLTQTELANLINVSHQAVSRWEKGDNLPDVEKIYELSVLFGVSTDDLIQSGKRQAQSSDNHSLGLYAAINNVFSVVALVLFYVLLLTTGTYWIAYIVQYPIVLGISLLYLLPFGRAKQKTRKDFMVVRTGLLFNLASLLLSLLSMFFVGIDFVLAWLIGIILTVVVLLYMVDAALRRYEINQFTQKKTTFRAQLFRNTVVGWIFKQAVLFVVAVTIMVLIETLSRTFGDGSDWEQGIKLVIQLVWFAVATGTALVLILKVGSLKKSPLHRYLFGIYVLTLVSIVYHVALAGTSVRENSFELLMQISSIASYINIALMSLGVIFIIIQTLKKKTQHLPLALQLIGLALLTYLMTSVGLESIRWGTLVEINFTLFGSLTYPILYVYIVLTLLLPKIKSIFEKKQIKQSS